MITKSKQNTKIKIIHYFIAALVVAGIFYAPVARAERTDAFFSDNTTYAGTGNDIGYAVMTDSAGSVYTSGQFQNTVDFDPTAGIDNRTSAGLDDFFLTKADASGNYVYTYSGGGTGGDNIYQFAFDAAGNVYIAVIFTGTVDLDPGAGVSSHTAAGGTDIALVKLDPNGLFVYAKAFGGTGSDVVFGVKSDNAGNVYLVGGFSNTVDFDPGAGVNNHTSNGNEDHFLAKFQDDGTFVYAKSFGSTAFERPYGIDFDSAGNIYMTGHFGGTTDFDPGAGTDNRISAGSDDVYVSKFQPDGTRVWTQTVGGTGADLGRGLDIDDNDNIYIEGVFSTTVDFDPGAGVNSRISAGAQDVFLLKLTTSGSFTSVQTFGGTGTDYVRASAIDASGNIYMTGYFASPTVDFDPTAGIDTHVNNGVEDIFFTRINSDGSYRYTKTIGGVGTERGYDITTNPDASRVFITGFFSNTTDFDPGSGVENATPAGLVDAYTTTFIQTTYQYINPLPSGMSVMNLSDGNEINDLADPGVERGVAVTGRLFVDSLPVADVPLQLMADGDWSAVNGASDVAIGKAFVNNLGTAPGVSGGYVLYVPKLSGSTAVGYCPSVTSMAELTTSCSGYSLKTTLSSGVSIVTIDGQEYWAIAGVSAGGGFNTMADVSLANTGQSTLWTIVIGLVSLTLGSGMLLTQRLLRR